MKYVRTARTYERLQVEVKGKTLTVDSVPREVAEDKVAELEKAAEQAGVEVVVYDHEPTFDELPAAVAFAQPQADLSEGRSAVSGTGPAVTNDTTGADQAAADTNDAGALVPAGENQES